MTIRRTGEHGKTLYQYMAESKYCAKGTYLLQVDTSSRARYYKWNGISWDKKVETKHLQREKIVKITTIPPEFMPIDYTIGMYMLTKYALYHIQAIIPLGQRSWIKVRSMGFYGAKKSYQWNKGIDIIHQPRYEFVGQLTDLPDEIYLRVLEAGLT